MKIRRFSLPRSHVVIDDFFSAQDLGRLWSEIKQLEPMMRIGLQGAGQNRYTDAKKNMNAGLDEKTKINGKKNVSMEIVRKAFWDPALLDRLEQNPDSAYLILKHCMAPHLHYSSYKNGDYYAAHKDSNIPTNLTIVVFFCKEPKKFTGGNFIIYYDGKKKNIHYKNNRVLIFPSNTPHEVTPVRMKSKKYEDSRITLQIWPTLAAVPNMVKAPKTKTPPKKIKPLDALAKNYRNAYFVPTFGIEKDVWNLVSEFFNLVQFRESWGGELDDVLLAPQMAVLALISNLKYIGRLFFEDKRVLFTNQVQKGPDNVDIVRVYGTFKEKNNTYSFGYLISQKSPKAGLHLFIQAKIGGEHFFEILPTTCDKGPKEVITSFRELFRKLVRKCNSTQNKMLAEKTLDTAIRGKIEAA